MALSKGAGAVALHTGTLSRPHHFGRGSAPTGICRSVPANRELHLLVPVPMQSPRGWWEGGYPGDGGFALKRADGDREQRYAAGERTHCGRALNAPIGFGRFPRSTGRQEAQPTGPSVVCTDQDV